MAGRVKEDVLQLDIPVGHTNLVHLCQGP
jgi:hypothetical protein